MESWEILENKIIAALQPEAQLLSVVRWFIRFPMLTAERLKP